MKMSKKNDRRATRRALMTNTTGMIITCLMLVMPQASCTAAANHSNAASNAVGQSSSDRELTKQVERFASSDATESTRAWKVLESSNRESLINQLTRLYEATPSDDYHRVLISFTFCKLNHNYAVNRNIVLSSLSKTLPYKRFYGDWAASLAHRLFVGGDKEVLAELFRAADWSDGAMSEELSGAYSDAIKSDPQGFLRVLAAQSGSNRIKVYELLKNNSLTNDESEKIKAYLRSVSPTSDLHSTAQETLKALQADATYHRDNVRSLMV